MSAKDTSKKVTKMNGGIRKIKAQDSVSERHGESQSG